MPSLPWSTRAPRRSACLLLSAAAALALAACGGSSARPPATAKPALTVVATTTQLGDIVREIAGPAAAVTTLVKPNQDPHDFEPTPGDVAAVARSQVVFKSGAGIDDWLDRILQNAGGKRPIVDLSTVVHLRTQGGEADPHYWMDPTNVEALIPAVRDALAGADPADAAAFGTRADDYLSRVRAMDRTAQATIDGIPANGRKMVTDHDAFRYFTDHFGLEYVGSVLQGLNTNQEPTTGQVTDLIAQIRAQDVKAIFTEQSLSPRLAQTLASEAHVKVVSNLYGDSLGAPGSGADTYIGMMETNARNIADALK